VLEINHVYRGDFLMNVGVNPQVDTYHTSVVMLIDEVKAR
jgi:alpha-galactosidase